MILCVSAKISVLACLLLDYQGYCFLVRYLLAKIKVGRGLGKGMERNLMLNVLELWSQTDMVLHSSFPTRQLCGLG